RPPRVHVRSGPMTRSPSPDGFVDGLQGFGLPPPCRPATGLLTVTPVGLSPTEHVSLSGRTSGRGVFPSPASSRGVSPSAVPCPRRHRGQAPSPRTLGSAVVWHGLRRRCPSCGFCWPLSGAQPASGAARDHLDPRVRRSGKVMLSSPSSLP